MIAKNRIRSVLNHDRANISPQFLELLNVELVKFLASYMDVDANQLVVTVDRASAGINAELVIKVPIKSVKDIKNNL